MKRVLYPAVLLVLLATALAAPAVALPSQYTVEPAFGVVGMAAADVAPITFWDLTIREMVIIGVLAISPVFVFPVEIFFALKLISCFGFRRIARSNVLASTIRNTIYNFIRSRPGISFIELLQETRISRGALTYHLTIMQITGKIVILKDHGISSYFENSGKYDKGEQKVLKYLRQDTDKQILVALSGKPLMSRRDFEKILGVSGPTVTWHMKRLIDDGLLSLCKDGRFSRYVLSAGTRSCLEKYRACMPDLPGSPAGTGTPGRYCGMAETAEL
ncbi:MAG: winged helix-turn-helix transcriptional regulator [Methanoregula sp.]|nr:winged helix-turn-helix transcriptional regulator [Methanoregula sp.]